jgi:hypothetical protein
MHVVRPFAKVFLALAIMVGVASPALAQKKVIRVNHAGAEDIVGTEHQMYSWIFANYINEKSPPSRCGCSPTAALASRAR